MKTAKWERVERVSVLLEQDIDFKEEDLVPNALVGSKLKELPRLKLIDICTDHDFTRCTWSGHYDTKTKTVHAIFEKELYL